MKQLSAFDSAFLDVEDSDRHVSLAVGSVSVLAGPMPDAATLATHLAERVALIPQFKQVVRTHLLDFASPELVADPHFDPAHHIRRVALPHPGGDRELFGLVAEVIEQRLDRDYPLWQCWLIDGLQDGRWAVLMKLHHCLADGIAAMHLFAALSDDGEGSTFATAIRAATVPSAGGAAPRSWSVNPLEWLAETWRRTVGATNAAVSIMQGALEMVDGVVRRTPTSLAGPVSARRRYSAVRVRLADVEQICSSFGVTVNDVALAAITDSYRSALVRRGEIPRRTSLRTLVPVSIRRGDGAGVAGNQVSAMLPLLPVDRPDPAEQLRAVHQQMSRVKRGGQRGAGGALVAASNVVPFPLGAWTLRAATRLPQRGVVALATNVPGPRQRLRIMGREVLSVLPISPIALGLRTGVAVLSYADELAFGVTGDYDTAPDVDALAQGIGRAITSLLAAGARSGAVSRGPCPEPPAPEPVVPTSAE